MLTESMLKTSGISKFEKLIEIVGQKNPLQKKKLKKFKEKTNEAYWVKAGDFADVYFPFFENEKISLNEVADSYLEMCRDMLQCQMYFVKQGKYPIPRSQDAVKNVYNNENKMSAYMVGLAVSQFLWSTHYEMFSFLVEKLKLNKAHIQSYLEIDPGHGIFLKNAVEILEDNARLVAVDISATSLKMTQSLLNYSLKKKTNIDYLNLDFLTFDQTQKFDFITMGEVLEHVDFPEKMLQKISELLSDQGSAFVSTCVNCPAIDHVFHFHSIEEIREMFGANGLDLVDELILPVEDLPFEEIMRRKITINYCALLKKKSWQNSKKSK